ncbi:hypothetical protein VTO42DRAFT_2162 [Malbranchea cinnamomea]
MPSAAHLAVIGPGDPLTQHHTNSKSKERENKRVDPGRPADYDGGHRNAGSSPLGALGVSLAPASVLQAYQHGKGQGCEACELRADSSRYHPNPAFRPMTGSAGHGSVEGRSWEQEKLDEVASPAWPSDSGW